LADKFASIRVLDPATAFDTATNSYEPESPCDPELVLPLPPPHPTVNRRVRKRETEVAFLIGLLLGSSGLATCPYG
jgi:hypothetical protein